MQEAAVTEKDAALKRDREGGRWAFEEVDWQREVLRACVAEVEHQAALLDERCVARAEAETAVAAREASVEEANGEWPHPWRWRSGSQRRSL